MATYPESDYTNEEGRLAYLLRDYIFACPVRAALHAMRAIEPNNPTYIYRFNRTQDNDPVGLVFGDYHSVELQYVFNDGEKHWRQPDYVLSAQMGW